MRPRGADAGRRGVVLVAVLVVVVLATMVAMGLMFFMRSEVATSAAQVRGEQAYQAAMNGVKIAMTVLQTSGNDMTVWYDNPDLFLNQLVADDGANKWYFTVYADDGSDVGITRYGVADEAGKLNLNTVPAETLLNLPNMTSALSDCLKDYIEPGTDPRPEGAKQDYYDTLAHPYTIAGAPLTTMDELLMVKGFTAEVIYGEDANLNGLLDANEDDGATSFPPDNADGKLDRGLRGMATVYTSEPNTDSSGRARINMNTATTLPAGIPALTGTLILAYRNDGNTFKHPSELLEMQYTLKNALDVAATSSATGSGGGGGGGGTTLPAGTSLASSVTSSNLATILDRLTAQDPKKPVLGLVNVNTASVDVLAALPGMDANTAQQIVDLRKDLDPSVKKSIAWLYTQDVLKADQFKAVAPYLTARSFQYYIKCIGYGWPCGRYRILEAVVDFSTATPRIAYLRDITQLGPPFALDPTVTEQTN
jgi:type II secretory pathway component PulK